MRCAAIYRQGSLRKCQRLRIKPFGRMIREKTSPSKGNGEEANQVTHALPKAFCVGSLAGLLGSLAGMGGGFVMIPLMTSSLLKLSQHQAHGTSLFAVTATGIAGALGYSGQVNLEAAAAVAACGMATARIGASLTHQLSERALKRALGVFMVAVAPLVPAKAYFLALSDAKELANQNSTFVSDNDPSIFSLIHRLGPPALIGIGSGFLAGLFGVGGGAVVVPALTVFTDMNHYQALGTSLCAMTLPAIVGTITHASNNNVAFRIAPALALGAFFGAYCGGRIGLQLNENALRWGFSGLMISLGIHTLIKA